MLPSKRKRILFIHHGSYDGGAPLSMLYTMQGLRDQGYEPIAGLISPLVQLRNLYENEGFETIKTPWIPTFITYSASEGNKLNPFTWFYLIRAFVKWRSAKTKLKKLVQESNIDFVHLNSVCLSNCAIALTEINFPFVWHVREYGPKRKGRRFKFIQNALERTENIIFLSNAERISWLGHQKKGNIVHNFIDFDKFNDIANSEQIRKEYNIKSDKVILYVGGLKTYKGIEWLLDSLLLYKEKYGDDFVCLMPDSLFDLENPKNSLEKIVLDKLNTKELFNNCILLPFNKRILDLFQVANVLVFPATKAHFSRPIIEASAMGKAVIGTDLPVINELISDQNTGLLVKLDDKEQLCTSLYTILSDKEKQEEFGKNGNKFAFENFESEKQISKICSIYNSMI